ncbi:hypothetical protein BTJ68_13040 [Hortaea werneckii EXF-2000]|uniref:Uncharacterized protein n=1 Tax=Hortaea werneckii EXF-2000 TaxID=1157616 RepID=A0A1Z5SSS3_HORWE|nr:hypothetical protein BTJ68_13040 [Hortaea werneckii EXF-2000]
MPSRKSKSRSPNPRGRQQQQHQANGSTSRAEDSASVTARLMGQSSFTLRRSPSATLDKEEGARIQAKASSNCRNKIGATFYCCVLLYFLQGIPMGLAGGSVPFLLKSYLSYGQIGVYSLGIISLFVEARFGRRKSWILPIQVLSGLRDDLARVTKPKR